MIDIGWEERVYPAAKIAVVLEGLAAEGVSAAAALQGVGLSLDELRSPTTLVSVTQVVQVYRNAIRLSHDPNFAFLTGLRTHVSSYGMFGFAILSSVDFRQTMHFAVHYHQLATPLVKLRFAEDGRQAVWTIDPPLHLVIDGRLYRFIVELQFGIVTSLQRDVMGSSFHPSSFEVTFEPARPPEQYEKDFGCPVAFRQPARTGWSLMQPGWTAPPHSATTSPTPQCWPSATTCMTVSSIGSVSRERSAASCSASLGGP